MNLINNTLINQNMALLSNWVDSTPVPQMIDTMTYDLYESSNPFRHDYRRESIKNSALRNGVNATKAVGAEVFSVFANPYYLTHKIVNIPTAYKSVVGVYKKYSSGTNGQA